ncbi:MAG: L,D-transpeptidase/peptidoglycan binding protein [Eubacterium sp.]|nr:L,D-transpeptidase/peptidoglycan binding protein [Eubacterium sp.]
MKQRFAEFSKKKKIGIIIGAIVILLAIVYVGISLYFMGHFHLNTTINGIAADGSSVQKVEEAITQKVDDYTLTLETRDGDAETITGTDISLAPHFNGEIEQLLQEQSSGFAWIYRAFTQVSYECETVLEYENLDEMLQKMDFMNADRQKEAVDAYLSDYNAETGGYEIVPEEEGTVIDEDALQVAVEDAITNLDEDLNLADSGCYVEAEVTQDDPQLQSVLKQANQYASCKVEYDFDEAGTQTLDGSTIHKWIKIKGTNVSLKKKKIEAYVHQLATNQNTIWGTRKLKTTGGKTVTIKGGSYGWWVDEDAEYKTLLSNIEDGETVTREPEYKQRAASHGETDYGDTYVEIDLSAQQLWFYVDGELKVSSNLVSGNPSKANGTPVGSYALSYKEKDATLNGDNYSTPVTYWMPFNNNIGMHDATWRSSFGGSIYKTNGSHGCINLPVSTAKTIFQYIEKGDPVLLYADASYSTDTSPKVEETTDEEEEKVSKKAKNVTKLIKAIGTVTLKKESKIKKARSQYNALSSTEKKQVKNYSTLTAAEKKLKKLKKKKKDN